MFLQAGHRVYQKHAYLILWSSLDFNLFFQAWYNHLKFESFVWQGANVWKRGQCIVFIYKGSLWLSLDFNSLVQVRYIRKASTHFYLTKITMIYDLIEPSQVIPVKHNKKQFQVESAFWKKKLSETKMASPQVISLAHMSINRRLSRLATTHNRPVRKLYKTQRFLAPQVL